MEDYREAIWGISPRDRQWFQLLTLIGGISGSVILTQLELQHGTLTPNETGRNILLGIGASFVASGFAGWGILQIKEFFMSIADWLKTINEKNREKLRQEGAKRGLEQGYGQGYEQGYRDASEGKPMQPPTQTNGSNSAHDDLKATE